MHASDLPTGPPGGLRAAWSDVHHGHVGFAQDITKYYSLGKVLGRGAFGTTRVCEEHATGEKFACKSISKRKLV